MWTKTIVATLWGLLLSVSVLFNVHNLGLLAPDVMLLIGTLLSFILWVVGMIYSLSCQSLWRANINCFIIFLISALANLIQVYF